MLDLRFYPYCSFVRVGFCNEHDASICSLIDIRAALVARKYAKLPILNLVKYFLTDDEPRCENRGKLLVVVLINDLAVIEC